MTSRVRDVIVIVTIAPDFEKRKNDVEKSAHSDKNGVQVLFWEVELELVAQLNDTENCS